MGKQTANTENIKGSTGRINMRKSTETGVHKHQRSTREWRTNRV